MAAVCLSDGFPVKGLAHEQRAVIGGDAKSAAIAAASVLAKETRDRYMRRADAATRAGSSPARRLLHPRASRGDRSRRLTAAPAVVSVDGYQQLALG